jgi:hypothetical protein
MKVRVSLISAKKTTSGRMLGCYILCSEILVKVDQLMVEGQGGSTTVKVKVVRQQVEGRGHGPGKVEFEYINDKSTEKRLKCRHDTTG